MKHIRIEMPQSKKSERAKHDNLALTDIVHVHRLVNACQMETNQRKIRKNTPVCDRRGERERESEVRCTHCTHTNIYEGP